MLVVNMFLKLKSIIDTSWLHISTTLINLFNQTLPFSQCSLKLKLTDQTAHLHHG